MSPFLKSFWILCCCLPFCLFAQNAIVTLDLINENEGMRNNLVRDVIMDSRGLIWMATPNGLHRYDGYSFSIYDNRGDSPAPLVSYNIYSIVEDGNGDIWIGTDNGISVLNPTTQSVRNYYNNGNEEYPPIKPRMKPSRLVKDKNGAIWFLEGGLLGRYTESLGFQYPYQKGLALYSELFIDNKDHIFLKNSDIGLTSIMDENRKLYQPEERIVSKVIPMIGNPIGGVLFYDGNGQINIYHSNEKLYTYHVETDSLELLSIEKNSINDIVVQILSRQLELNSSSINTNRKKEMFNVFKVEKGKGNLFWIATNRGLLKATIVKSFFRFDEQLDRASLRGLYEHDNGDIYIGGYIPFSFLRYNLKRKEINYASDILNCWSTNRLNKDTLLLTNDGLSQLTYFDVNKQKVVYKTNVSSVLTTIRATIVLPNKQVIFGSETGGLFIANNSNIGEVTKFNFQEPDPQLKDIKVNCSFQESDSVFWLGSTNRIVEVDLRKQKATVHDIVDLDNERIGSREVWDIFKNGRGDFWLATTNGLVYYDPVYKKSKFYFTVDGLSDNLVYSILPEDSTALWLATNNGLSKFNISQQKFYIYTGADGIRNHEFNRNSSLATKEGQLFFGGLNGFTSFYPSEIEENEFQFKAFISAYSIYDRSKSKLTEYIPERRNGQTIHLDPDNRNITFRLGLTDYRNPKKASFDVMLQGFDEDWITNRNTNEVRYTNLDAGNYIFKVRATNSYGQTSLEEDFVRLVVVKPWHTSTWFYGLLVLLIAGSIVAMYLSQIAYERNTNRLRNRIANDLHDEVSNTLNNIRIVALDARRGDRKANSEDIDKIEAMSSYAIDHLQDVIWAIDLENQDIKYLLFRMEDNIDSLLRDRQVPVELKKINLDEEATLDFLFRRNLLLIFKEALSNIVKHSKPSKVVVTIGNINGHFILSVKNYIDERLEASYKTGRGTISMTQRAMALKGELETKDSGDAYEVLLTLNKTL
ncbi:MAG: ligand-binding sensor domain-containing protein/two-component sensor histidine kinase [Gammaproteobacteria bacterium]|jgi:ligand-binding sensor domain-containing protein/two-component sensor histidine kinase